MALSDFWRKRIFELIQERLFVTVFSTAAILLALFSLGFGFFSLRSVPPPLVLHYNAQYGVLERGELWELELYGVFVLGLILVINFLAWEAEEKDWFWGKVLAATAFLFAILLFFGFQAIIAVN